LVEDFKDWGDIQDMIDDGTITAKVVDDAIAKSGIKFLYMTFDQFCNVVTKIQDGMVDGDGKDKEYDDDFDEDDFDIDDEDDDGEDGDDDDDEDDDDDNDYDDVIGNNNDNAEDDNDAYLDEDFKELIGNAKVSALITCCHITSSLICYCSPHHFP
jgi:hypothetical protein